MTSMTIAPTHRRGTGPAAVPPAPPPMPLEGEHTPRPVVAFATDMAADAVIAPHAHRRGQLLHATQGVMLIRAETGSWVVPPGCAVWVPPQASHEIRMAAGPVAMRTVFVEPGLRPGLWEHCRVVQVTPLLRELVLEALDLPLDYPLGGREERVMQLILDEMERARPLDLHVPMPRHAALAACCRAFVDEPAQEASLSGWGLRLHMHPRTLARLFLRETGMNFGAWCRQARLLLSLPRLAAGSSVLQVALSHGYDSPSAFAAVFRRNFGAPPSNFQGQRPSARRTRQAGRP
ncbi:AraC family transcriptional regulator [Delftia tsuruhatensis]|uniref:AraC family transcriptional regulator n=1 Tax=Delftia tsuruhatensis TaxID=180282 RepID=UPI003AEF21CF